MNNQPSEVRLCPTTDCPLYLLRFGKRSKGTLALKAIKKRCLDCGDGTAQAVAKCEFPKCQLNPYRNGHNPARKGLGGKTGVFAPRGS